jgi:pSer/pThr/pTyr-binding forkhead associated (FHA) protein
VAGEVNLEVVEGPDAGKQVTLDRSIVIGRAADADLVLEDGEVSGHHVRVTPDAAGSATVEDLDSTNGTFINQNELIGSAHLEAGDDLLVGVSVIQLRTAQEVASGVSRVIQLPPALATAPRPPTYVNPEVARVETGGAVAAVPAASRLEIEKYLDVRVRRRAQLAPVALTVLVAIALILYFSLK